ncbi:TIGR03089 family protein [Saccharomonospora marina XMU15]|uniref:TIGR03089 family protein n=1 Tax=Saccharomonospora marina XMU15 TaxID=882083 RepID=H5X994_9PSEU|nr:TIGR03089 family protein [Saccharomonospora marina]EHR49196.1 TIGR03089 family protein [Saccharomonospora marina XMU15]
MSLTEHLLRPLLKSSAARPLITHYDDEAGSRIELSVATVANWAAKTANWLVEEFDVEPGDEVSVELPAHWQTAGVLLGAWWCGAQVVTGGGGVAVAFVGPEAAVEQAGRTAMVALDPLGRGLGSRCPEGAVDYLTEARLSGDEFAPVLPIPDDTPALLGSPVGEVLGRARERATALGIGAGDRVLSARPWTLPDGVVDALLAPLAAGAHLVQVTNATADKLAAHREEERTTVDLT